MPRPCHTVRPVLIASALMLALGGCTAGVDLPAPKPVPTQAPPDLVDLRSLPAPTAARDPGPALLSRADALRAGGG